MDFVFWFVVAALRFMRHASLMLKERRWLLSLQTLIAHTTLLVNICSHIQAEDNQATGHEFLLLWF
jgi:hypothetical protein